MTKDDMTILQVIKAAMEEIEYHHADMLTEHERNHPRGSGWARVYDKLAAAREVALSTDKERDRLTTIPFNMGNRQKHGLFEKNRGRELRKTEPDCKNLGKSAILAC